MIVISVLGLDQFVVAQYSKNHTENLASIFECVEDDINFYAPQSMVFHKGVEQTSWHTIVTVRAPRREEVFEASVAKYLISTLSSFSINLEITFMYYEEGKLYTHINEEYPLYIEESNLMEVNEELEEEENDGDDEADPRDRADLDPNDESQIYLGDAFASHEEELECCSDDCDCGKKHNHKG